MTMTTEYAERQCCHCPNSGSRIPLPPIIDPTDQAPPPHHLPTPIELLRLVFLGPMTPPSPKFHSSSLQPELNPPSSKSSCFGRRKDSFLDFRSSYLEVVIVFATRPPGRSPQSFLICGRNYVQT